VLACYTIRCLLGGGGASVVQLARQQSLDRDVAIKVLRRDVDERRVWEWLLRGLFLAARRNEDRKELALTVHDAAVSPGEPHRSVARRRGLQTLHRGKARIAAREEWQVATFKEARWSSCFRGVTGC
jgi:hypothetical protein